MNLSLKVLFIVVKQTDKLQLHPVLTAIIASNSDKYQTQP